MQGVYGDEQPFHAESHKVLDLVHMGIAGPRAPAILTASEHLQIFRDDFTCFTVGYPILTRSLAYHSLHDYKMKYDNLHETTIKRLRSDNAPEFVGINSNFQKELGEKIIHETTCYYQ